MPFANHSGHRLYWRLEGETDRPVLLLLHSIGTDMTMWDAAMPYLLPHFRVLRMDLRGHGASDAPGGDYTLDLLADDALAVMDGAGISRAVVCGLSLGGIVGMMLTLKAPGRVTSLVLACTSAAMDAKIWQARLDLLAKGGMAAIVEMVLERFFSSGFRQANPARVAAARDGLLAMTVAGYAGCAAAIRDMALLDRIGVIACPVLVISGARDISTPFAGHGARIVAAIAGAKSVTLDAAHLAAMEVPAAFASALLAFLMPNEAQDQAAQVQYETGLKVRRSVLGDAWVEKSLNNRTAFNTEFQAMITRHAWNDIWARPGLDHATRRLLVIAMTASLGCWDEFRLHVRAALEDGGIGEETLKEVLMQVAIYAGVPAANTAFHEAGEILAQKRGPEQV